MGIDNYSKANYALSIMDGITPYVERAIERFGSQAKLAAAAGVAQPTVFKARATGRVGIKLALGIEAATNGDIPKSALRPDIWPPTKGDLIKITRLKKAQKRGGIRAR